MRGWVVEVLDDDDVWFGYVACVCVQCVVVCVCLVGVWFVACDDRCCCCVVDHWFEFGEYAVD